MGEQFKKFKRRADVICLLKSIFAGVTAGLIVAGVLFFLHNHKIIALLPLYSALIGVATAVVFAGISIILLRVSDKSLAKQIDDSFSLNEKVQTMLAYKDETGVMLDLQRDDAETSLAKINTSSFKPRRLWVYVLCLALGISIFVCSLVILPAPEPYVPPEEKPFSITDIQIAALEELILYVEDSEMESPYREGVALAVTDLLAELRLVTTESARDEAITGALDEILEHTDASSFAVEFMNAMWSNASTESARRLAKLLNYYEWPLADEIDAFEEALSDFRTTLMHADSISESPDANKMAEETEQLLRSIASGITLALTTTGVPKEDALYIALNRLAISDAVDENEVRIWGLAKIASMTEEIGYYGMQSEIDSSLNVLKSEIFSVLERQMTNTGTGEYAIKRICTLFDFEIPSFERPNFYDTAPDDNIPGGDEDGTGGAGIGGETVYGSDDLVLDPITNTYVEYGTVLDKYYALMFSKTEDGDYTEAEREAMEKYFAILYGGFEEK